MTDERFKLEPAAGRVPPSDLDAEAAVLAACLLEPEALDLVREVLSPEHMYADANRRILEAAYAIQDETKPVDFVQVAGWLRDKGRLDQIGGSVYLAQLTTATPSVVNVVEHAERVKEKARLRRMISLCQKNAAEGYGDVGEVAKWLDRVEQEVFDAAENENAEEHAETFLELMPDVLDILRAKRDSGSRVAGIDTGWPGLNDVLNGWIAGKFYVISGRPGMGKSGLGLAACINVARTGKMAIFISAEMDRHELGLRAACLIARVSIERAMSGYVTVDELVRLTEAAEELARLPMVISQRPGATIAQVRSDVRRKVSEMRKRFGDLELGMVAVDYMQIMNGNRQRNDSRENEVSALSKGLMWLAGEFRCVVLGLSQLNRECEKRPDHRPINADLRDSGSLEQDAYAIIHVYRDDYYDKNSPDKGIAELLITKHRNGKTGTVRLKFTGEWVEFSALEPEEITTFDDWAPQ